MAKLRLNPYFETMLLLLVPDWDKAQKKETIAELDDQGVNGAAFYKANLGVVERYYAAFSSRRTDSPGSKIIADLDGRSLTLLIALFWRHPDWFDQIDDLPDEVVFDAVRADVADLLEGGNVVEILDSEDYSDQARWQIMALLQRPKARLASVARAVRENLPAFEHARSKVQNELDPLLDQFEDYMKTDAPEEVVPLPRKLDPQAETIPTLAQPMAVLLFDGVGFCGLLVSRLVGRGGRFTDEEAVLTGKALGDASRLGILLALKDRSLYNLEIADRVGLTPATTSHHMNMLLATGLVEIEKRGGKVFYHLSSGGIKRYLDWLTDNLT